MAAGSSFETVSTALGLALRLITGFDPALLEIVVLSLSISLGAIAIATPPALLLGAALAVLRFPGQRFMTVFLSASMGLPPVVVGLAVYLLLSRAGPLGSLGLLFTPGAMVIAETLLVLPIIAAIARQSIADLWRDCREQLLSLGASPTRAIPTLLWEDRFSLLTAILAGFGRASAEVGAVMIVGGNIAHVTRTMTTAITLEISKGNLALALALGAVLITLSFAVNAAAFLVQKIALRRN